MLAGSAVGQSADRVAVKRLFAPPEAIRAEVAKVLESFGLPHTGDGYGAGHIFNLGHGISQYTPPEHVSVLVDAVHDYSRRMRQ